MTFFKCFNPLNIRLNLPTRSVDIACHNNIKTARQVLSFRIIPIIPLRMTSCEKNTDYSIESCLLSSFHKFSSFLHTEIIFSPTAISFAFTSLMYILLDGLEGLIYLYNMLKYAKVTIRIRLNLR